MLYGVTELDAATFALAPLLLTAVVVIPVSPPPATPPASIPCEPSAKTNERVLVGQDVILRRIANPPAGASALLDQIWRPADHANISKVFSSVQNDLNINPEYLNIS
jgi:hypothetical protein